MSQPQMSRAMLAALGVVCVACAAGVARGMVASRSFEIPDSVPFRAAGQPAISPVISHNEDYVIDDGPGASVRVVNQVRRADGSEYGWVVLRPMGWGPWGWNRTGYGRDGARPNHLPPARYRDGRRLNRWGGWSVRTRADASLVSAADWSGAWRR